MEVSTGLAGPALGLGVGDSADAGGGSGQFANPLPQDRLVRKEVSLGVVREIVPPQNHIGLSLIAPFLPVETDEVVFQYILGSSTGLAPARADDAESELYQQDDVFGNEGRASVIDWAVKNVYKPSDVERYRQWLLIQQQIRDTQALNLTVGSATEGFQQKLARDTARRRGMLDNRIESLIIGALPTGVLAYNDGRIKFSVDFGRPAQQNLVPGATMNSTAAGNATMKASSWIKSDGTGDPVADILAIQNWAYDTYGVRLTRAIASRKILNQMWASQKFQALTGMVFPGTAATGATPIDPAYLIDGWSPLAAQRKIEAITGVTFIEYDAVYRTRAVGSTTTVNNRFLPQGVVVFLPDEQDIAAFDDTDIGFAKTLTSPHPAGNWSSGFYEWEKNHGVDPWRYDAGTGIKAFPVFLHMELTFTYTFPALDGTA